MLLKISHLKYEDDIELLIQENLMEEKLENFLDSLDYKDTTYKIEKKINTKELIIKMLSLGYSAN